MQKISIFKKIDNLYTKVTEKIIGDIPMDEVSLTSTIATTSPTQNPLHTLKTLIKKSILTLGSPKEKDVLYKEVIKKEKQEAKALEKEEKLALKASKALVKERKIANQKVLAKKKSMVKKSTVKETAKETAKETTMRKKTSSKKSASSVNLRPTRADKIALYAKDIKKHYGEVDEDFLVIIVKNLGPSIYRKNAELVSCSDPKELSTVRNNFLIKKLGIGASQGVLDAAIQDVCEELKSTRIKYRATFYYSLAKKFKKESVLS